MKSIPISKIDALIASLESAEVPVEGVNYYDWQIVNEVIETLRGLKKKEAIPSLEQKIKDRITELEQEKKEAEGKRGIFTNCLIEKIDELRKLLQE